MLVAFLPVAVLAQDASSSFEELRSSGRIQEGQTIRIIDRSGTTIDGRLESISAESLALNTQGARRDFSEASVREIRRRGDELKNGMGYGLMGGLALGGIMVGASSHGDSESSAYGVAIGLPIMAGAGLGVGALIDFIIRGDETVFRAPAAASRGRGLKLEPILSTTKTGAKVSLSF